MISNEVPNYEIDDQKFATRLKESFDKSSYQNQKEIANECGISEGTLSGWFKGNNLPKGLSTIVPLCKALGVSLDYLCGLSEDPHSNKSTDKVELQTYDEAFQMVQLLKNCFRDNEIEHWREGPSQYELTDQFRIIIRDSTLIDFIQQYNVIVDAKQNLQLPDDRKKMMFDDLFKALAEQRKKVPVPLPFPASDQAERGN